MVKSSAMDGAGFTDEQIEIIKQANQDLADKIAGLGGQDQLEERSGLTGSDLEQVTTARMNMTFGDYEVQDGDNLSMIAYNNNVSVDDLVQANPDIEDLNNIQPGQTIKIPPNLGTGSLNPDDISDLDALGDPKATYQGGVGAGDDAVDQAAIKTAQDNLGTNAVDTTLDDGPLAVDDPLASVQNVKNSLGQDPIPYSPEAIDQLNLSPETEKILNAFKLNPENLQMDANAVGELMKRSGMTDEQAAEMLNAIGDSDVESTIELARSYAGPVDPSIDLDAPQGEFGTTDFDGDGKIDAIDKTVSTQGSLSAADLKQAGMNLDTIQELGPESMEVLNGLDLDPETLESVKQWIEIEKSLEYELPPNLLGKIWKGKFRGQKQKWYIVKFLGNDEEINLNTKHPEFIEWKWVDPDKITKLVVEFKLHVYERIQEEVKKILVN